MKNLSLVDNVWIERINPNITSEERTILEDKTMPPSEAKKALMENIRSRSSKPSDPSDATAAQAIYDQHKLSDAVLIAADISFPGGHGIINCRVNNEHKQVRF